MKAKIIEVDAERRRLSLSLKRVEGGGVTERADDAEAVEGTPNLDLSEEVFPESSAARRGGSDCPSPNRSRSSSPPPEEPAAEEPVAEQPADEPRRRGSPGARRGAGARAGRRARRPRLPPTSPSSLARPIAVAITGGIGAGKSEALAAFARHGAATISSDDIVHRLLREDEAVRAALLERFGDDVLDEDGEVDRGAIAEIVFADREALEWLEGLLHPLVVQEYMGWRERLAELDDPPSVTATEVPLLYEVGGEDRFDAVVVVTAPPRCAPSAPTSRPRSASRGCCQTRSRWPRPTSPTSTTARSSSSTTSCRPCYGS